MDTGIRMCNTDEPSDWNVRAPGSQVSALHFYCLNRPTLIELVKQRLECNKITHTQKTDLKWKRAFVRLNVEVVVLCLNLILFHLRK